MASLHNHPAVVRRLLEHRAHTALNDAWGCSPLHNAAGRGYLDIVQLLVEAGADINTRWGEGIWSERSTSVISGLTEPRHPWT